MANQDSGVDVSLAYGVETTRGVTPTGSIKGTLSGAVINGAVAEGATTLALDGAAGGGTILKGDRFTVASVAGEYFFTSAYTADGGGVIASAAFQPPAPAGGFGDDAAITLVDRPAMKVLRTLNKRINEQRDRLTNRELTSHGQPVQDRHGFRQIAAGLQFQLSRADFDDLMVLVTSDAGAAGGTTAATTLNAVAATGGNAAKYTRAAGSFVTDGHQEGDWITASGFTNAANNGRHLVKSVAALSLEVYGDLTAESGGGNEAIAGPGKRFLLKNDAEVKSWFVERQFQVSHRYQLFNGVAAQSLRFQLQPNEIVTGELNLLGMSGTAMKTTSVNAAPTVASTNEVFDTFSGALYLANQAVANVTGIEFTLDLRRQVQRVLFSKFTPDIYKSMVQIPGQVSAFLTDEVMYNLFYNETLFSLGFRMDDPNGTDWHGFYFPVVKVFEAPLDPPAEGPIPMPLTMNASYSTTLGTSLVWCRSNA